MYLMYSKIDFMGHLITPQKYVLACIPRGKHIYKKNVKG